MAQHDYVIANASGATVRADINNMALAISSNNSGSSAPGTTYAYLWWLDTSANVLKLRNSANNAWITMPFSVTASNTVDINGGAIDGTAIGASAASTGAFTSITGSLASTITTTDNTDTLSLISTDADASVGPNLRMYRNSGSPADSDVIAAIDFDGRNDNSQDVQYAQIIGQVYDVSDGTEDAALYLQTMVGGTTRERITLKPTESVVNENGIDLDFRVESNNNANMLFVDGGNDRVGLGTASPSSSLHVFGNSSTRNTIVSNITLDGGTSVSYPYSGFGFGIDFIGIDYGNAVRNYAGIYSLMETSSSNSGGGDAGFTTGLSFYTNTGGASGTNPTEKVRIDASGNLLVNTTNTLPANNNVQGIALSAGSYGGRLEASRSGGAPCSFNRVDSDGSIIEIRRAGTSIGTLGVGNSNDLTIGTADTGLVFQDNERISPWNPSTNSLRDNAIDLGDTDRRFKDLYLSNYAIVSDGTRTLYVGQDGNGGLIGTSTNHYTRFITNNTERMRIVSNGQVCFNSTVIATASASCGFNPNSNTGAELYYGRPSSFTGTGNAILVYHDGTYIGGINSSTNATSFLTSSDYRLKENIKPLENGLDRVSNLKPVQFDWKVDGKSSEGFIAHEAQEVFPDAVSGEKDDEEMQAMDYGRITPLLVKAIQEQQEQIEQLKTEIQTLKGE